MNDINLLKNRLVKLSGIKESFVIDKIGQKGINGADGWVKIKNASAQSRALWLPDADDVAFFGKSELKKVYRFYVSDNPPSHPSSTGGTGLVKLDVNAGTIQFLDQQKYVANDQKLTGSWGRTYKIDSVTVFNKKFLENQ